VTKRRPVRVAGPALRTTLGWAMRPLTRKYPEVIGDLLLQRYQVSGDPETLAVAVELLRDSLARSPDDGIKRGARLSSLGTALRLQFEASGDIAQLAEAEVAGRAAAGCLPAGPLRSRAEFNLAGTLVRIAAQRGDAACVEEAVRMCRAGIDAFEPDTFGLEQAQFRSQLGGALLTLFRLTGNEAALEEAIASLRHAADELPSWHPLRGGTLSTLGGALARLAERRGDGNLLQEAAHVVRKALETAPPGKARRAAYLSQLAAVLLLVVEFGDELRVSMGLADEEGAALLADALRMAREAVDVTAPGDGLRHVMLGSLGNVLLTAFDRADAAGEVGAGSDAGTAVRRAALATEAVDVIEAAVAATPDDHPDRAAYLNNLALALRAASIATEDTRLLLDAAQVARAAMEASSPGHPTHALSRFSRMVILRELAERTGDSGLREEAHAHDTEVAADVAAPTPLRIGAYRRIAAHAAQTGDAAAALAWIEAAIELAQRLAPRTLGRRDRELRLVELSGLAGEAAAAGVNAGCPARAVELLEQTRGLLVADLLDARGGDLVRLGTTEPELARSVEVLRDDREALDGPDPLRPGKFGPDHDATFRVARDLAANRRAADAAWDDLITRIRAIDGFADIFRPPPISDLAAQACDGPVVFVYVSPARCDALIVTGDADEPVRVVPLTALRFEDLYERLTALTSASERGYAGDEGASAQASILRALAWAWDTIAGPALEALG
jgi:tetratricopeptide (TPR) repeat protein